MRAAGARRRSGPKDFIRKCAARLGMGKPASLSREPFLTLTAESSGPGRARALRKHVRFTAKIGGPNAARLEIVCVNPRRDPGARIRLEIAAEGRILSSSAAGIPAGRSWVSLDFPAVRVPPDGLLTFDLRTEGAGTGIAAEASAETGGDVMTYRVFSRDERAVYSRWIEVNEGYPAAEAADDVPAHVRVITEAAGASDVRNLLESLQRQKGRVSWELCGTDQAGEDTFICGSGDGKAPPDLILLANPDVELAAGALAGFVNEARRFRESDFFYGDADRRDADGNRSGPFFRPDFSPHYLLSYNWLDGLCAMRPRLYNEVHGRTLRDAAFMGALKAHSARHIPKISHHHCGTGPQSASAAAIRGALKEFGIRAEAVPGKAPGYTDIRYTLPEDPPLVSIIIPSHDEPGTLRTCVRSILERTGYPLLEILIAENNSTDPETFEVYESFADDPRIRVERFDGPFNYSRVNNLAASGARGQYLLFLNNDTEVRTSDWLERMLALASQPHVGAVGAKLLYPDGTVQHGGVAVRVLGIAGHMHQGMAGSEDGYYGRLVVPSEVTAVTGACLLVSRSIFEEAGGFDEGLALAFNDIDLCLRIREKGRNILLEPRACLYHHESRTRGYEVTPEQRTRFAAEQDRWLNKWGEKYPCDPFYNPNLRYDTCAFDVAPEATGASASRMAALYSTEGVPSA